MNDETPKTEVQPRTEGDSTHLVNEKVLSDNAAESGGGNGGGGGRSTLSAIFGVARFAVPILIVGFLALGGLDLFDNKKTVDEVPSSPGYEFVHSLDKKGAIDDFRAVEPDDGWDWQYEINDGDASVRFRGEPGREELEYESSDSGLETTLREEAIALGYTGL
jgi:hypothetical protein